MSGLPELLTSLVGKKARVPRKDRGAGAAQDPEQGDDRRLQARRSHRGHLPGLWWQAYAQKTELGTLTQFRCHIGHVYTAEVMVAAQFAALEWSMEAAMRSLSERGDLCRQMADKARSGGDTDVAEHWTAAMHEAKERTGIVRELLEKESDPPRHLLALKRRAR